ncbi:MAG: ribonuclease P protein component [Alistipes sp.]
MSDQTLSHAERLRSLGVIRRLFERGESGFVYPFRYLFFAEACDVPTAKVLFSVPKKYHKRANKRNLLRRRTKEAYRLNKQLLSASKHPAAMDLALIYTTKDVTDYKKIEQSVRKILQQVVERL